MMWLINQYICPQRLPVVHSLFCAISKISALVVLLFAVSVAYASVERITQYEYDGAGNIVGISFIEQAGAPTVIQLSRLFINRGDRIQVIAMGENLLGADVLADEEGLTITNVVSSNEEVSFILTASTDVVLGNASLRFVTGLGEASQTIIVAPTAPVLITTPNPIVIEGNGLTTNVTLSFAEPRSEQETYTLTIANRDIVTTAQTSFTINAGQRQVVLALTGIIDGVTSLEIELAEALSRYIFSVTVSRSFFDVLEEYPDIQQDSIFSPHVGVVVSPEVNVEQSIYSNPVGVVVSSEVDVERSIYSNPVGVVVSSEVDVERSIYSDPVGIIIEPLVNNVEPTLAVSNSNIVIELTGVNLQTVQSVAISPAADFTFGGFIASADGVELSIALGIGDVPVGIYQIILTGMQGVVPTNLDAPLQLTIE